MSIINEQIVTGRKFRKLIDEASRLWLRISFWTKACDVEFDDGETAETKFSNMLTTINDLKRSFQDGVNKIFNYLKGLGFTPNPNSPDGICAAIKNIYDKRYSDGRTQGQADVVANPGAYGVSTEIKYFGVHEVHHENSTFPIYTCPADGNYHISIKAICENTHTHDSEGNHIHLIFPDQTIVVYEHKHHANGWETTGEYHKENYRVVYDITKYLQAGATISLGLSYSDSSGKYDGDAYLHNVRTIVPLTIN